MFHADSRYNICNPSSLHRHILTIHLQDDHLFSQQGQPGLVPLSAEPCKTTGSQQERGIAVDHLRGFQMFPGLLVPHWCPMTSTASLRLAYGSELCTTVFPTSSSKDSGCFRQKSKHGKPLRLKCVRIAALLLVQSTCPRTTWARDQQKSCCLNIMQQGSQHVTGSS